MAQQKIVLAYSGGLDTSVAIRWLQEHYDAEVVTLTIDLGMVDLESIRQRALSIGAVNAVGIDGREDLVQGVPVSCIAGRGHLRGAVPLGDSLGPTTNRPVSGGCGAG